MCHLFSLHYLHYNSARITRPELREVFCTPLKISCCVCFFSLVYYIIWFWTTLDYFSSFLELARLTLSFTLHPIPLFFAPFPRLGSHAAVLPIGSHVLPHVRVGCGLVVFWVTGGVDCAVRPQSCSYPFICVPLSISKVLWSSCQNTFCRDFVVLTT